MGGVGSGRQPIYGKAMTDTQRTQRYRERAMAKQKAEALESQQAGTDTPPAADDEWDARKWFIGVARDGHMDNLGDGVVISAKDRIRAAENTVTLFPAEGEDLIGRPKKVAQDAIGDAQAATEEANELERAKEKARRAEWLEAKEEREARNESRAT